MKLIFAIPALAIAACCFTGASLTAQTEAPRVVHLGNPSYAPVPGILNLQAQQNRNPESEAEARKVIDSFSEAGNKRDLEGMRNALNFPYVRIASGSVRIARTREEFTSDTPARWRDEDWHHSAIDSVEFIQSSSDKVHAAVIFSRYKADGTRYATYRTLRIITKQNGHWGIQCSSSFAP